MPLTPQTFIAAPRAITGSFAAATLFFLGACTSGLDYARPEPTALSLPSTYTGGGARSASPEELAHWWEVLGDSVLDRLVDEAINGNLDIAISLTRLRQAREASIQAGAARWPTIGASGGLRRTIGSDREARTIFSADSDASWEADLFGGLSRTIEATRAEVQAAGLDMAAVRVAMIGEVASNYVQARLAQQRLDVARDTLAIADENLEIAGWRRQAGLVSSLDVEQARGARAHSAATIPALERSFAGASFRLAVLTGQAPGAISPLLVPPRPVPQANADVAVGIPADTLRQRPDVQAAERSLAAATARIGIAEAELRPGLRLTGNIGSAALSPAGLVDALAGNLFAGLSQTLFDGGRLRSQVRSRKAAAEGALASYRQSVLTALEDVENGLAALGSARRRQEQFRIALEAATNQAVLARSQYRAGLGDFQTLLEAERSVLAAREGLIASLADQTLAVVQLYRALGGGWDSSEPTQSGSQS